MKKLQNKLEKLLQKRDKMNMAHMQRYKDGSATRARTTTYNARSADLNEQIQEVRDELKIYGV
jgi:ribosome modulation factor